MFEVIYRANALARVLNHGCALEDEQLVGVTDLYELNQAWGQQAQKVWENQEFDYDPRPIPGWDEVYNPWERERKLSYTTGGKRLRVEVRGSMLSLEFWAGQEGETPPRIVLGITCYSDPNSRWYVWKIDSSLRKGERVDRIAILRRLDYELGGEIKSQLQREVAADEGNLQLSLRWDQRHLLRCLKKLEAEASAETSPA